MRLLVFAPHPDDEILGCGGLLQRLCAEKKSVRVVLVSAGGAGGDPATRLAEAAAGLEMLGVSPPECWDYPDGALPLGTEIQARYRTTVAAWRPTHIALPAPGEAHPDHRRLTRGLLEALTGNWQGELLFYETTTPLPTSNRVEPIDLAVKLAALACHVSQQTQFDYRAHASGLAALRGASIGCAAGEAYLAYAWDGSPQNFFEQRPLVSVVMRAADRGFLAVALSSVRAQDYDHLEIVVVWHGNDPLPDDRDMPDLALRVLRGPGPRSANLNAGLAAARGQYVAFLDQDDVLHPGHLSALLTELHGDPELDIAYGDHRLVTCRRRGDAVEVVAVKPVRVEDYRPGRLLAGNFIPLHSFLCSLRLARRLRFDTALDAYEDWDFLARAELDGAQFRRVDAVVADYRLYPKGGAMEDLSASHERKGFLVWTDTVKQKLLARLDVAAFCNLTRLVGYLENERNLAREKLAALEMSALAQQRQLESLREENRRAEAWADLLAPGALSEPAAMRLAGRAFADGPCFAILLPVCDPAPEHLIEAIHSVEQQTYPHWVLCVADDASTHSGVQALLDAIETRANVDVRYRLVRRPTRGGIVAATASARALAADIAWLAFLDHDDRLAPDALLEAATILRRRPELGALYTDSRMIGRNGELLHEYRKPGWAPETLLHLNYINHLTLVRAEHYDALGGLRPECEGSQDWDLWLRLSRAPDCAVAHIDRPLYDWRASETSLAYSLANKPYALMAASRALENHLAARGIEARAAPATGASGFVLDWAAQLRALTVIVPTHRNPDDLARLLVNLAASTYPDLRVVLVANRVGDAATRAQLAAAAERPGWQVVEDERTFNWSALNNAAARLTDTPWLLFLNDDVELPEPDTLSRLARYLTLDAAVGAVGARLEYAEEQGGASSTMALKPIHSGWRAT
jgi:LmbE family N-acetylglucosaminyl deacetylase/glycosyltransferase involved in cell wall biosynthesis